MLISVKMFSKYDHKKVERRDLFGDLIRGSQFLGKTAVERDEKIREERMETEKKKVERANEVKQHL